MALNPRHWVATHADYLYTYALSRLNDEECAHDLVQDTFLAALEGAGSFEGRSSERTWLTAILKNKIIDIYRKRASGLRPGGGKQSEMEPDAFFEEDGHWRLDQAPKEFGITTEDRMEKKEFEQVLQKCISRLPVLWKAVFTMKHIDEEETVTICNELKVTSSNFWVIIHRAKLSLRACLQKNWI